MMPTDELAALGGLLWFLLAAGLVLLAAAPLVIWRNTSRANRLLQELIEEQRRTNQALGVLRYQLMQLAADARREPEPDPEPGFTLEEQ